MEILQCLWWILVGLLWITGVLILWFKSPPVPSRRQAIENGLKAAGVRAGDLVIDLGTGDGRVLQAARDECGARIMGWELHPLMWLITKFRLGWDSDIKLSNLWKAPLGQADVVFVFLMPSLMARVEKELLPKLKPGARLISNSFPLPNVQPNVQLGRAFVYVRPGQVN
jgi:hypothetical protein